MAFHYIAPGPSPIVIRGEYTHFRGPVFAWNMWRLIGVNETTGWARLRSMGMGHAIRLVSLAELSHWRLMNRSTIDT